MGRRNYKYKNDDDALSDLNLSPEKYKENVISSLNVDLDDLYDKRRPTREKALSSIIKTFIFDVQFVYDFAEENFVSLVDRYLNSIKHGAEREISLACEALGLLALTLRSKDRASKLLREESFTIISRALTCNSEKTKAEIVDCLAMITFIGGNDLEEIARAMKIIWQFIHKKSGSHVVASHSMTSRAIFAWSFVLTAMANWGTIDSKDWLELASHFSNLLEAENLSVRMAAGDALALLFEIEDSENFPDDDIETLKQKILLQVEYLSTQAGGRGSSKKKLSHTTRNWGL